MGHIISKEGISPADDKIEAIKAARDRRNATEARSFLGLVNVCARFIPNLATVAEPLRQSTRTGKELQWGKEQATAFAGLKNTSQDTTLVLFDRSSGVRRGFFSIASNTPCLETCVHEIFYLGHRTRKNGERSIRT